MGSGWAAAAADYHEELLFIPFTSLSVIQLVIVIERVREITVTPQVVAPSI